MSSKLHDHLVLLRPEERKPFRRYLQSPYHNRNPLLIELFRILSRHLDQEPPREMHEEEAFAHLFPGQKFDQNRYRKLATGLLQGLREFWVAEALQGDRPRQELYLLRRFSHDNADRFIPSQIASLQASIQHHPLTPEDKAEFALAADMEAYQFETSQPDRSPQIIPEDILQHLESSYRSRKIKLLYLQLNHFFITGQGSRPEAEDFLQGLEQQMDQLPTPTRLYTLLYRCAEDTERLAEYARYTRELSENAGRILQEESVNFYTGALNFCTRRINLGDREFVREMWNLYVEMLDKGMLARDSDLLAAHLKNIMAVSARLGEFEWAHDLLDRLAVEKDERNNGIDFGRGVLAYFQRKPVMARRHFHRILDDYDDMFFGLDARVYLLRIYYETADFSALDSLCDSFRMFLKRKRGIPRARKANYNHFLKCIRRLGRIPPFEKEKLEKLRREIEEGRRISATGWLLGKVDELLPNR